MGMEMETLNGGMAMVNLRLKLKAEKASEPSWDG